MGGGRGEEVQDRVSVGRGSFHSDHGHPSFLNKKCVWRGDFLILFFFFLGIPCQFELKGCPLTLLHFQSKTCNR